MRDIKSMTIEELSEELKVLGHPKYRAEQIYVWLQKKGVESFDEMTNISKQLREQLAEKFEIGRALIEKRYDSKLDDTSKYLFKMNDGEFIEAVLMHYHHGYSICISSPATEIS